MHPEVQSPVTGRWRVVTRSRRDLRHRQGGVFLLRRTTGVSTLKQCKLRSTSFLRFVADFLGCRPNPKLQSSPK